MYKYKVVNVEKQGKKNLYSLNVLGTSEVITIDTNGLKAEISKGAVTNAIVKGGKIEEATDKVWACQYLMEGLDGSPYIGVKITKVASDGQRRYMKIYNSKGNDITNIVYKVLDEETGFTKNRELSIAGYGMNIVSYMIQKLNDEGTKCGLGRLVHPSYTEVK